MNYQDGLETDQNIGGTLRSSTNENIPIIKGFSENNAFNEGIEKSDSVGGTLQRQRSGSDMLDSCSKHHLSN